MRCESGQSLPAIIIAVGLIYAGLLVQTRAQTATSKIQTFGSSLKRSKTSASGQPDKTAQKRTDTDTSSAEDVVRVETSLVQLDLLVTDAGGSRYISGLTRDDFVVTEDDRPQQISTFTLGDDAARLPRSIVLIFDRSDSQLAYLDASIKAAKRLVEQLAPTDEMAIVTDDVQLAVGFTKDKKKLKQTLDSLRKWTLEGYRTRSMQFSALLATLRELIGPEIKRPIIIFQTDGDEVGRLSGWPPVAGEQVTEYGYDVNDIYAEVEKSRAKIYTVIPNDRLIGLPEGEADRRALLMLDKQRAACAAVSFSSLGAFCQDIDDPPSHAMCG
jgi:VWFA-related protein